MRFWHLLILVILFFGTTFGADLEGSGSGDIVDTPEAAILEPQNLLNSVPSEASGSEIDASGEDVQTFFF